MFSVENAALNPKFRLSDSVSTATFGPHNPQESDFVGKGSKFLFRSERGAAFADFE
jgi:hypothetical protein